MLRISPVRDRGRRRDGSAKGADPDRRIGSLLVNPGGPGGSGVNFAIRSNRYFRSDAQARFVRFDPRGVARSQPVLCTQELLARQPSHHPRNAWELFSRTFRTGVVSLTDGPTEPEQPSLPRGSATVSIGALRTWEPQHVDIYGAPAACVGLMFACWRVTPGYWPANRQHVRVSGQHVGMRPTHGLPGRGRYRPSSAWMRMSSASVVAPVTWLMIAAACRA
jgi:hypothetical protein